MLHPRLHGGRRLSLTALPPHFPTTSGIGSGTRSIGALAGYRSLAQPHVEGMTGGDPASSLDCQPPDNPDATADTGRPQLGADSPRRPGVHSARQPSRGDGESRIIAGLTRQTAPTSRHDAMSAARAGERDLLTFRLSVSSRRVAVAIVSAAGEPDRQPPFPNPKNWTRRGILESATTLQRATALGANSRRRGILVPTSQIHALRRRLPSGRTQAAKGPDGCKAPSASSATRQTRDDQE